jgi:hypothetical protein
MPTPTYTPLATVTLGSSASSVTFSSIPATYRDLILVVDGTTNATHNVGMRFNGDTGNNYFMVTAFGNGSTTSSVTFSSIPATYRDLILVTNGASNITSEFAYIRFNGDTGSNYSWVQMGGGAVGVFSSSSTTTSWRISSFAASGNRVVSAVQIMDYSATDKHKSGLIRDNGQEGTTNVVRAYAARWANTSAITSIQYFTSTGSLSSGFTLSLYGIAS